MIDFVIFLINIIPMAAVGWWVYRKQSAPVRAFYWPAMVLKMLAGIGVGLLYFYHYGAGDTISYWLDGKLVAEEIISEPLDALSFFWNDSYPGENVEGLINDRPRSIFFVKIAGILALLSGGNYWIMATLISFVSFFGAWYLFTRIVALIPSSRGPAAISFLFFPSVVFWSSGLIKESLGLASLFFLSGIFLSTCYFEKIRIGEWVVALLSLWIGWNLKYYWIGIFMPVAITTLMIVFLTRRRPALARFELGGWMGVFVILLLAGTSAHPNFYPQRFLEVMVSSNLEFMKLTSPENAVHYAELKASPISVLLNAPQALVAGFFRPAVWEAHNGLSLAAGFENMILLLLVATGMTSLSGFFKSPHRVFIFAVIVYIVLLAIFLSLSTPNFGTLARYKVGFIPFLVFLAIYKNPIRVWWSNRQ